MKNIEKYKDILLKNLNFCRMETDIRKQGGKPVIDCPHTSCEECKEKFFKWLLSEYKEPVLDDAERKYLSEVIRPFRKKIIYISKVNHGDDSQYINIMINSKYGFMDSLIFPTFDNDTMYKGMEVNKEYSLEDLGL